MRKFKVNIFVLAAFLFLSVCQIALAGQAVRRPAASKSLSGEARQHDQMKESRRPTKAQIQAAVQLVPQSYRKDVGITLKRAGQNAGELIRAIEQAPPEQREGMAFLVANMPSRDFRSLKADFLIENIHLAYEARDKIPWGKDIPKDIFLNNVLPYVSVNERRDNWRRDFYGRFLPSAQQSANIEAAVAKLNILPFETFKIGYNIIKRPKPDQSPYETIEAGVASCTGLSIFLVDVLRSAGIPSRLVVIPWWPDNSGNHTWVEVWTPGGWHHIGANEPTPLDQAWFSKKASQINPASAREHRIYASSFKKTGLSLPMRWNPEIHSVPAEDVTARYSCPVFPCESEVRGKKSEAL